MCSSPQAIRPPCKARGLKEGEVICEFIDGFLKENEGQTTLATFPHERKDLEGLFDKASVMLTRRELERILSLLELNQGDPERRNEFQLDLAKALRLVEPVYRRTHDSKLGDLLAQAEAKLG